MSFETNWASPPGATVARLMDVREIPKDELADGLGLDTTALDRLIRGEMRISEQLAIALSNNLGSTTSLWLTRDKTYLRDLARIGEAKSDDLVSWTRSMPVKSMKTFGWISKNSKGELLANELLQFFGCSNLREWGIQYSRGVGEVAFKTSLAFETDPMATLIWMRAGERQIESLALPQFDRDAFAEKLPALKKISAFKHPRLIIERLKSACRKLGVAVTTARAPEGCRARGATWISKNGHPTIHLSFRHMSEDQFWFTFFHEAAHVILHGENHIDAEGNSSQAVDSAKREDEADIFAKEVLVSCSILDRLNMSKLTTTNVIAAAREAGVTPGILVGQLERAKVLAHGRMSFLKHRYRWGSDPLIPDLV